MTLPGSGLAAVLVAVVGDEDLVVLAVEDHAVRIAEAGLGAADHAQWCVRAAGVLRVDDDLARPFDADRDFLAHRIDRQAPGLVGDAQEALRLDVAIGIVGEHHHPIADVVVDGVDLRASGSTVTAAMNIIPVDGPRMPVIGATGSLPLDAMRRSYGPDSMAVGIAHEHAVVDRIDGNAVQRRVRIGYDPGRGYVAAGDVRSGPVRPGLRRRRRCRDVEAAVLASEREQSRAAK